MPAVDSPLAGVTILTTRAAGQGLELQSLLESMGARVIHLPTIEFAPPASWEPLDRAIERLNAYDWLVLTSANAVDAFLDRAGTLPDIRVAAVGPQTERRLGERNVPVHLVPPRYRAEGLIEAMPEDLSGVAILLPRAEVGDEALPETLRGRGARVDVVPVYGTRVPLDGPDELRRMLEGGAVDCITLTSGSTARNLLTMAGPAATRLSGVALAVIGPVTRRACEELGLQVSIEAADATIPDLVVAIRDHFAR